MNHQSARPPRTAHWMITLTLWGYRALLQLHPSRFRRAFGADIVQVFRETCYVAYQRGGPFGVVRLWAGAIGDVAQGAFAEHIEVFATYLKGSTPMITYRRSASTVFGAYIVFVLAGIGFAKLSEGVMQSSLPTEHPVLAIAYDVVLVGSVLSLLGILVGGLPLAWAAVRYGLAQQRRDILLRFAVPPAALLVIWGALQVVVRLNIGGNTTATIHTLPRILAIGGFIALFVAGAIVSTMAVLDAIARSDIDGSWLRFTFVPGVFTSLAMGAMLLGVASWSVGLWQTAPKLFWGNEGVLASSTLVSILVMLILMLGATLVVVRAMAQGAALRRNPAHLA